MGYAFPAEWDLAPGVADTLSQKYGPPVDRPGVTAPPPDGISDAPPTAEEMRRYGASDADIVVGTRGAAPGQSVSSPALNPAWVAQNTPKEAPKPTGAWTTKDLERAPDTTPQGPRGPDGFPTYRDLNNTGSAMPAAPSGPARLVPGGWQPSSRGSSTVHGIDESKLEEGQYLRNVATGQGMIAADKRLEAAQQQGMADAVYSAAHAAASQHAAEEMQRIENEKRAYVAAEHEKLNTMAVAAQKQVDPEAAKGSGGAQLMAAIGIALGQFGASLTGGQNAALAIVNANIDRNIKAQEMNIANAGKAHDREQSLYRQNLEAFGDKERATLATKMQYLDQVKAIADQQYASAKGSANEAQYHELLQGLNDKKAEIADQFGIRTADQVTSQQHDAYRPPQMVGGPGAGMKGREKLLVPTLGGYARDEETARKLNTHAAIRSQINEDLHEIHSLLDESKKLNSVTDYGRMQEVRQRIDGLKHGVLQKTTVLADQGAMSKGDQSVAEVRSQLESVDPQLKTDAQIGRMQKGLRSVATSHQRDARLEGEANGIQLGQEQYRAGPNGPEPAAVLAGRNKVVTKKAESVDDLIEPPKGKVEK